MLVSGESIDTAFCHNRLGLPMSVCTSMVQDIGYPRSADSENRGALFQVPNATSTVLQAPGTRAKLHSARNTSQTLSPCISNKT